MKPLNERLVELKVKVGGVDFSRPLSERLAATQMPQNTARTTSPVPTENKNQGLIPATKVAIQNTKDAYHNAVDPTIKKVEGGVLKEPTKLMAFLGSATSFEREAKQVNQPTETPVIQPEDKKPGPVTHKIRGMDISEDELKEARDILFSEISNRGNGKKAFEVKNVLNVAINRAMASGTSLTEVLQAPSQFQGYAPKGTTGKGGKVIESQYQKIKAGKLTEPDKKKLEEIEAALNDFKIGNVEDITGGKQFYVHATDGTMWFGSTIAEAKKNALDHEKANSKKKSQFGTSVGMPAQ